MSALKDTLTEHMKTAMRAKDKVRLGVIRLALAAIKQREVDERIDLDDTQVLAVIDKMVKQRRDSMEQFQKGKRDDLVKIEQFEIEVLQEFLPQALDESEISDIVAKAIEKTGASTMKDMGKLMAELKPQVQGRADMSIVSQKVKQALAG